MSKRLVKQPKQEQDQEPNDAVAGVYDPVVAQAVDEKIKASKYVSIDEFNEYLKGLLSRDSVEEIGFDFETNGLKSHIPWFYLSVVSAYDRSTGYGLATALHHPEVFVTGTHRRLLISAYGILYGLLSQTQETFDAQEYATRIDTWLDFHKKAKKDPWNLVTSETEDQLRGVLDGFVTILTYKKKYSVVEKLEIIRSSRDQLVDFQKFLEGLIFNADYAEKRRKLFNLLSAVLAKHTVVGHNLPFDVTCAYRFNLGEQNIRVAADSYGSASLIYGGMDEKLDLGTLARDRLGVESPWKDAVKNHPRYDETKERIRYDKIPLSVLGPYAAADSCVALEVQKHVLDEGLRNMNQTDLAKHQNRAIEAFSLAMVHGFTVDMGVFSRLQTVYRKELEDCINTINALPTVKRFLQDNGLLSFNNAVNGKHSHKATIFFDNKYFGLKSLGATKSGFPSFDKDVVAELKKQLQQSIRRFFEYQDKGSDDPLYLPLSCNNSEPLDKHRVVSYKEALHCLMLIEKYATFAKLASSYINNAVIIDGAYYPAFNLIGATITGRLSSGFHTIPKHSDLKKLYVSAWNSGSTRHYREYNEKIIPGERYKPVGFKAGSKRGGGVILMGDFSQLELRFLAAVSGCEKLRQAFVSGEDIHAKVAQMVFPELRDVPVAEIKRKHGDKRSYTKSINFGILYGKGLSGLAEELSVSEVEAQKIMDFYFKEMPEIEAWIKAQHKFVKEYGFISDVFGRIRHLPDALLDGRSDQHLIDGALRRAQNTPIQGGASTLAWIACADIRNGLKKQQMNSVMIGGVHDSIINDIYPGELVRAIEVVDYAIDKACSYPFINGVPIEFDTAIGVSWGRLLDIKRKVVGAHGVELVLEGGDVDWRLLEHEFKLGYDGAYRVTDYGIIDSCGDPENDYVEHSKHTVQVSVEIDRDCF